MYTSDRQNELNRAAEAVSKLGISPATFKDTTVYKRMNVKGKGGQIKLMETQVNKLVGDSNLDGNMLAQNRHYIIDGARILADSGAASLGAATWEADLLPQLLNSELEIEQNGNTIFKMPIADLHKKELANGSNFSVNSEFRSIANPVVLFPQKQFEIKINMPDGTSVPAGTDFYISVEFRAFEAYSK
ncbi:hypothetical protein [Flavobacterium sp. CAU 1735]|uniref:hypothetical protein n=1 Tax=Flavobacterium sp. CAU 1735 TaxID=3140361 RepID=UPI0032615DED